MKFGVIGIGSIGLRHIKNIKNLGFEVVGHDTNKSKASDLKKIGINFIKNKKEFLSFIDAGIISTPTEYHLDGMSMLVNNNKHCLVEKPLSHEINETKNILNLATKKKLIIQVGHNLRFNPAIKFAKKLLENNYIGEILWARLICSSFLPNWRKNYDYKNSYANKKKSGGVIFDCIHEIDLAYHLFGTGKVISANSRNTQTLGLKVEDISNITIKHSKGFFSNIHLDYVTQPKTRITEIAGKNGILKIDVSKRRIEFTNTKGRVVKEKIFKSKLNCDYTNEIINFHKYIIEKKNNKLNQQDNLNVLKLAIDAKNLSS